MVKRPQSSGTAATRLFLATVWIITLGPSGCAPLSIKARAEAILTLNRNSAPDDHVTLAATRLRPDELAAKRLRSYDTRTLELLFEALDVADEARASEPSVQAMQAIFDTTLQRGFVGHLPERLHAKHIGRRDWARAQALYGQLSWDSLKVPTIIEEDAPRGPSVYDLSADGSTLTLRQIDISTGALIVSVADPGCHFSAGAIASIESDPDLSRAFSRAVNLYPGLNGIDTAGLARQNRTGAFRYTVVEKRERWTFVERWATPQFFFLRDGQIVDHITGWRPPDTLDQLRAALRRLDSRH